MIDASDPGGTILGPIDPRPTTTADDAYWDETGFTATRGAADSAAGTAGPDGPPRRPWWVPVEG